MCHLSSTSITKESKSMAWWTPPSITSFKIVLSTFLTLLLISHSLKRGHATEAIPKTRSTSHSVQVNSILPSLACKPSSSAGPGEKSTLKIMDSNGPCHEGEYNKLTLAQIFDQDQSRVASIQSRFTSTSNTDKINDQKTTIPAKSGLSLGSGNYIISVGLGTPRKNYNLIFDTGSDLTWTQCQPCVKSCYRQNDPIYNPKKSRTYSNVSCASPQCALLVAGTGNTPSCSGSTCVYGIKYGGNSFSIGFFGKETLALATDAFPGFLFGCGQYNQGLYGRVDGLLGLGRSTISVVSQTARKYGKVFSYCLPSPSGSNGYLTFGKSVYPRSMKFTPFSRFKSNGNFYFIDTVAISVGGRQLPINPLVFRVAGTVVDSGTVITRLPPSAYTALRTAFKQQMAKYKPAPAFSLLDTCYDFRGVRSINIPKISFIFGGNANVDLGVNNIVVAASVSQVCLAFAANSKDTNLGIFGNIQQQTMQVVYDVAGGRLGFGARGCS